MIRFIIAFIFVILFFTVSLLILPVEWLIGRFHPSLMERSTLAIVKWSFRTLLWLAGCKPRVIGYENVPKDEAVLYIGNHLSFFDIIITYTLVPGQTGYISKKENRIPILAQYMKILHCLFLDRKDIRQGMKTILEAIQLVKDGVSIFIFPEGTRSRTGELLPFKEGSFKIASKSGCKIVPVAISGSSAVFEDHVPWLKKSEVIVEYGKPFTIAEIPEDMRKFPGRYTHDLIGSMLQKHVDQL